MPAQTARPWGNPLARSHVAVVVGVFRTGRPFPSDLPLMRPGATDKGGVETLAG